MKKIILLVMTLVSMVVMFGCEEERKVVYIEENNPPAIPQGVYSVTGDGRVSIYWLPVQDEDLDYYRVWWNDEPTGQFEVIGTSTQLYYIDTDVDNGVTYYYAVTAVDNDGNESELSYENVYDTPRPEGQNQSLYEFVGHPDGSGFDLSAAQVVPYNSVNADFYIDFDTDLETFFINVADEETDIQDLGYTADFDEIGYAPADGWSFVGWSEIIEGHTYVIWTRDDHFAKIRVTYADYDNFDNIIFDWAYQTSTTDPGRMELARPPHAEDYLRHDVRNKDMLLIRGN